MKSLFSTIMNNSLFNFAKRLAIVCVFLSISAAAAAGGSKKVQAKASFTTTGTGKGMVYASTSKSTPTDWSEQEYATQEYEANTTFYWHAKGKTGNYFLGWYEDANQRTFKSKNNPYSEDVDLPTFGGTNAVTYYAHFETLDNVEITFKRPRIEGTTYTVKPQSQAKLSVNDDDANDLICSYKSKVGISSETDLKMQLLVTNCPESHRLYAWRITENGNTIDYRVPYDINAKSQTNMNKTGYTYTFSASAIVEPIFVLNEFAMYVVGNEFANYEKYYDNLQDALNVAKGDVSKRVTVISTGKLNTTHGTEYTIPEEVTLVVPGEEDFRYNIGGLRTEDIIKSASGYKEFVKFSLPHNAILNVEGGLSVYAKLTSGGTVAATSYGQIHLEDNSDTGGSDGAKINIKPGGIVNVYGYITGKPDYTKVNVETGGSIYELLQVRDWRGGNATVATAITNKGKGVFPMNQYYVHNVETMLELHRGATEYVSFGVLMSNDIVTTDAVFLTTRDYTDEQVGLFLLSEKSIIQKYLDKKTDRLILKVKSDDDADITNAADKSIMSNVVLTISNNNVNSADYVLPIPCNYDIYITENTYMEIKNRVAFLAGSTLHVDATSKLVALSDVFVYDNEQHVVNLTKDLDNVKKGWHNYFGVSNSAIARNTSQPTITYNRETEDLILDDNTGKKIMKSDAQLIIDGTLEGKIYTTASGATITSNGGGRIKLTELNANLTTTNQVIQYTSSGLFSTPAVEVVAIPLSSKTQLRNEDESVQGAESNTTYVYYKPNSETMGYWKIPEIEVIDIKGDGDEDDFIVYTPEVTSHNVTCKIVTDVEGFSDFTFTVSTGETSRFADEIIPNFDPSTSRLTIPLTYSPSSKHDEEYREEITLTIKYTDPDGTSKEKTRTIALIVKQDYQPQFRLQIGEYTYSEDGNYVYPDVVVGQESTPAFLIQPVGDNIAATNYVSWVKTVENPFSIDEVNSYLVFKPTSAGNYNNKVLRVCATYNNGTPDNADDDVQTCISINLTANGILQNNDLVLKNEKIAVIKANTLDLTFEDLFDGEGNGKPVIFTPVGTANTYATITAVDGKYRIVGVEVNEEVEFSYNQAPTTAMKEATGTLKVEVKPEVKFNWKYLYYGNTFTDPIDTENTGWTLSVKDPTSDCGKLINLVNSAGEWSATVATPADPTPECKVSFVYKQGVNTIEFGPIPVFSDPKILSLCVEDGVSAERTYEAMTIKEQTKNVKFVKQSGDNDDYVEFKYIDDSNENRPVWSIEFIGVAEKLTFDIIDGGANDEWLIEDITTVQQTIFSGTLKNGTNTIPLGTNTQKLRITYVGNVSVQWRNICITELTLSSNSNKLYLPIEIMDDGSQSTTACPVQISYTISSVGDAIRVVDVNNNILPSISCNFTELPSIGEKRVATQELVITNNSCDVEGNYKLLIGDNFELPISTYLYPQLLPVVSEEWTGEKNEHFYYYLQSYNINKPRNNPRYMIWDETKQTIQMQVPIGGGSRDITFAYKGGPATIRFDVSKIVTFTGWRDHWAVEESADADRWDPVTSEEKKPVITVNGNLSTIELPTLKYTSKYIKIVNSEIDECSISNLKIEGVPAVDVVVPHEGHYVEPGVVDVEGKLNFSSGDASVLNVMAVNLTKLKVKLNKPELFDVQLEGKTVNTAGCILDNSHLSIGTHRVGEVSMNIAWNQVTNIDQAELTFYNVLEDANGNEQEVLMATVKLLGAKDYITISNAKETGVFTGINEELYPDHPFKDEDNDKYKYAYREVDLTNTFDADSIALFDYLVVYTETTADGTNTILPPSKTTVSNAETPYFIYRKAQNPETLQYDRYQFVCDVENANTGEKGKLHTKLDEQGNPLIPHAKLGTTEVLDQGMQYIDIAENEHLSVYMTGFCPYASTGYTKDDEGVWIFRGKSTSQLDVYLEDCHIYSRNKTLDGRPYTGKDDPRANIFQEDFARGSGGVLVFECNTEPVDGATPSAFKVNIHTRGTNLLKSNYGCFYQIFGMRAYQVSSPVQIRLTSNTYVNFSETHLTFDDLWPTELTTKTINGVEVTSYDSIRTNGFISLQKQANNAPSIDMGNGNTVVNFRGGQVELQNAENVSDKYKTTLAISYRSGIMATGGIALQMAHGIGTDAAEEGTVNFYDGTITVIPMKVDEKDRRYYLMDPELKPNGDTVKVNGEVVRTEWTSCLRCPQKTYVYGGSICMLRACMSPTSIGGAPTDGPDLGKQFGGKPLGRYIYNASDGKYSYNTQDGTIPTTDEDKADLSKWLVTLTDFPHAEYFNNLLGYYSGTSYHQYGLNSITPNEDGQVILWLPEGYGNVSVEKDRYYTAWEACMPIISATLAGEGANEIGGTIGGNVQIDNIEDVDNLLYCQLDDSVYAKISKLDAEDNYIYEAPIKVPDGFKMPGFEGLLGDYLRLPPSAVGPQFGHEVINTSEYNINSKVYFISSVADADIWQTFTAPFDVEKIWIVESFDENVLKTISPTDKELEAGIVKRDKILGVQAIHNADFASFFAVAMALGSEDTFEEIYQDYIVWAATEEDKHEGDISTYTKRGKMELIPYDGTNWSDAHFYLYHNTGNWTIKNNADEGKFETKWEYVQKQGEVLLKQGETYSLLFPYCTGCWNEEEEKRSFWDYWSGKFLIFESTQASNTKPHKMRGADYVGASKPADGNWVFPSAEETTNSTEAIVTGNSTFAHMTTQRSDIFIYSPEKLNETFYPISGDELIYPTTAFLVANPPAKNDMPARGIKRTGEIIYGKENTPTDVNPGGNIPTVGGGNDLFITDIVGGVNIAVAEPQYVRVMSATGSVIFSGMVQTAVDVTLPTTGVYVITGENEVHKILH